MRVSAIHTYPVKGCRGLGHDSTTVEPWGLAGDRRWVIVDPGGVAVTQRDVHTLGQLRAEPGPGGLTLSYQDREPLLVPPLRPEPQATAKVWGATVAATPAGTAADVWLSDCFGRPMRLLWLDDPAGRRFSPGAGEAGDVVSFVDALPLLLTNTASLHRLNDWIAEGGSDEGPLPMHRFRPNLVVDGAEPFQEDQWIGTTLHIGQVPFRVVRGCGRCLVTTIDQATGETGKEPCCRWAATATSTGNCCSGCT